MSLEEFPLHLPRNAFGPRDTARAGDVWRLFQDAAVLGSSRRGWPPERYRAAGCAFIVRMMTVVHLGPTAFGEQLDARTWVSSFQRDMMTNRQVRLTGPSGPVAATTQRWVHVSMPALKPSRASPELREAFGVVRQDGEADVVLPAIDKREGSVHELRFEAWHTWMDPLAHANHPAYVDWADEALARLLAARRLDPQGLQPCADQVVWRSGVVAPEQVTVQTRAIGLSGDGVACAHTFLGADGRLCAEGTTIRTHADLSPAALLAALAG